MSKLTISVSHKVAEDEALLRVKKLLKKVKAEFKNEVSDLSETWKGNTGTFKFKIRNFSISGTLKVTNNNIVLSGEIPFVLSIFKGKIESTIRQQIAALFLN